MGSAGCGSAAAAVNLSDDNRPLKAPAWTASGNVTYDF
jgi:hypothetical protein